MHTVYGDNLWPMERNQDFSVVAIPNSICFYRKTLYFTIAQKARTPSRQPIFFPSS